MYLYLMHTCNKPAVSHSGDDTPVHAYYVHVLLQKAMYIKQSYGTKGCSCTLRAAATHKKSLEPIGQILYSINQLIKLYL